MLGLESDGAGLSCPPEDHVAHHTYRKQGSGTSVGTGTTPSRCKHGNEKAGKFPPERERPNNLKSSIAIEIPKKYICCLHHFKVI